MGNLRELAARFAGLFGRRNSETDLEEELRSHVEMAAELNRRQGMSPEEAHRQALLSFGGVAQTKEIYREQRGLPMIETLLQDLRYALRMLRKNPGFTTVAVLSLALGIGANTAIFSLIDAVILKQLPVSHPEELRHVITAGMGGSFTNPQWEQLRDRQDVFAGVFAYGGARLNMSQGGESRYANGSWVSGDYFSTLGVGSVLGRTLAPGDDRRGCAGIAVLTYDFWQREYAGDRSVLDKKLLFDGHPFQIVGVAQAGFSGVEVGRQLDVFLPLCSEAILSGPASSLFQATHWWLQVMGRPRPGLSPQQVTARLRTIAPEIMKSTLPPKWPTDRQQSYLRRSFDTEAAAHGLSSLRQQYRRALITLLVMVGVVLLIACANVANLLLARATVRQREMAIRLAIGAGRGRLLQQLLTESMLLSFAGAALGMLLAQWGTRLLVAFLSSTGDPVALDLRMDSSVLAFTVAIAVATGILFGLAPAWRSARTEPQSAMKATARGIAEGHTRFSAGKVLVAAQVALSLVLLIGAGLLLGTFRNLATLDPGFSREHVLIAGVNFRGAQYPPQRITSASQELLQVVRSVPGVRTASFSNITPIGHSAWNELLVVDGYTAKSDDDALANFNEVSPGYFAALGTPLLAGRDFDEHDSPASTTVAIINETMARRFFGNTSPLGRRFRTQDGKDLGPPVEIIGVVKDSKYLSLRETIEPAAYLAIYQHKELGFQTSFEILAAGAPSGLMPAITKAIGSIDPGIRVDFITLSNQVNESLKREGLLATLSVFFGILALTLATIGLYGVMSYKMARRRNEIGIRMALGAGRREIVEMVLREALLLAGIGIAVGIPVALAATRIAASAISGLLYGLKATDVTTIGIATFALIVVAAFAGFQPARRASRIDPMVALREE